jgi:hypothetical protein
MYNITWKQFKDRIEECAKLARVQDDDLFSYADCDPMEVSEIIVTRTINKNGVAWVDINDIKMREKL